jgi:hypothetical protein
MLVLSYKLHHATTTAVQVAAPVPEIMDIPSYIVVLGTVKDEAVPMP